MSISSSVTQQVDFFCATFKALTDHEPFPWQEALFAEFALGKFRNACLPTGLGKTSIMTMWLLALAQQAEQCGDLRSITVPRRLVWVVNRRVVVDQATQEAQQLRDRLHARASTELRRICLALKRLAPYSSDLIGISTLRGELADNGEWRGDPSRPAIVIGTVDMIGSRLLFSGYGAGFRTKPLHASFLGQDVLLVHDEAHLEPAFQCLITAIKEEQKRCKEFKKFHVLALSATSRRDERDGTEEKPFELTEQERSHEPFSSEPTQPVERVWKRMAAKKKLILEKPVEKLADAIGDCALAFKDTGRAVLIYSSWVEDVKPIHDRLKKAGQDTEILTGTQRGFERSCLATTPVFQRFLPESDRDKNVNSISGTVYLVCTSAGEVGINISADHLVCDLSTFDSMVQRFGRVNRFGLRDDTEIHVIPPATFKENKLEQQRKKTLDLLQRLDGDASPQAIDKLDPMVRADAFAPEPRILPATDILFDAWALTSIRGKLPGRPPVEPYLHGVNEWEPPETHVAWREEVERITGDLRSQYAPDDLLEDYPLKPHELLRDVSSRISDELAKIAENNPEAPVWLLDNDGSVEVLKLEDLIQKSRKDRINGKTVLLSPKAGGLKDGFLDGRSEIADDVADKWTNEEGRQRRRRLWDNDPEFIDKKKGMRLIRRIVFTTPEDEGEESDTANHASWCWYESPKSADNEISETTPKEIEWQDHVDDVVYYATIIVNGLDLDPEIRNAVILAAKFHDLGKKRDLFQWIIGNRNLDVPLAKSDKKSAISLSPHYRHEFSSLIDLSGGDSAAVSEFNSLNDDMKELVLHLVAAHHGRARPHFTPEEAFDRDSTKEMSTAIAVAVPGRFARLQRKYGRWGLAYLESLLRAADYAASANPSSKSEDN